MTIREYIDKAITSGSKVTIKYVKFDGCLSTRTISELEYSDEFGDDTSLHFVICAKSDEHLKFLEYERLMVYLLSQR